MGRGGSSVTFGYKTGKFASQVMVDLIEAIS